MAVCDEFQSDADGTTTPLSNLITTPQQSGEVVDDIFTCCTTQHDCVQLLELSPFSHLWLTREDKQQPSLYRFIGNIPQTPVSQNLLYEVE
ncbi:CLUMA_CG017266, isoform A [Clunio marinus]|uniref:CLUMA_CG017266, isoform A n=1 Tax=Clunio marinus TaxID=568069 RepID=A0A1J1IV68_9DIPT|nr:CLUMA_CG017266, isoform A [Clunio marinus]